MRILFPLRASWARRLFTFLALLFLLLTQATAGSSGGGVRELSKLPPVGVHPRVFFTAEEIPLIRKRLETTTFGGKYMRIVEHVRSEMLREWSQFSQMDFSEPSVEQLQKYVIASEGRNIRWGMASLYGVAFEDAELRDVMIGTIVNYSKCLIASREMKVGGDMVGRTGIQLGKQFNMWDHDGYDVSVSWTIGASGLALSYDVLFNDMSEEQRAIVRKAIAVSTAGRRGYGAGKARGYAASNHYGYHGDLAVLLCAIEGEEGYDAETYKEISQVLKDYWEVGFTDAGACHEDGYGPNLGLRAGSRGLLAMARRGYNIFETQKYRNFIEYYAKEYEPFPAGAFIGGESGGPYDRLYPTCAIIARYMYPESELASYVYRYHIGDDFERDFKWQGWLDFMIFGDDWFGAEGREETLEASGVALTSYYPVRGKQVFRSDWSEDALQFTLDARSDAFLIGHDRVGRGNFTLSALGRRWATAGDFREFRGSDRHSLIHVDGKAQAYKAPSVRFLWQQDDPEKGSIAVADLKYAYDWEWTPPWPKMDTPAFQSWEEERSSPFDLGWPEAHRADWMPDELFGSETGYAHTNGLRRRPYNVMEQVVRASVAVRGDHPFVVLFDEIKKDHETRSYEWMMQVPTDLEIKKQAGRDVIIGEIGVEPTAGEPCFLVRVLNAGEAFGKTPSTIDFELETYVAHEDKRSDTKRMAQRLTFSVDSNEPHFRVLLLPFRVGQALPETHDHNGIISVAWSDQQSKVYYRANSEKGLLLKID